MGIRLLCTAAVMVVGIGQAEAATVTGTFVFAEAVSWHWDPDTGEWPSTPLGEWWGSPIGTPLAAVLDIAEEAGAVTSLALTVAGKRLFTSDWVTVQNGIIESDEGHSGWDYAALTWDGVTGFWSGYLDHPVNGWGASGSFTPDVAPVPLPATAALLPLGIGALAMMRKRRRS